MQRERCTCFSGKVNCIRCGGLGYVPVEVNCIRCGGSGYEKNINIWIPEDARCSKCGGSGKEEERKSCSTCNGSGKDDCIFCRGVGYIEFNDQDDREFNPYSFSSPSYSSGPFNKIDVNSYNYYDSLSTYSSDSFNRMDTNVDSGHVYDNHHYTIQGYDKNDLRRTRGKLFLSNFTPLNIILAIAGFLLGIIISGAQNLIMAIFIGVIGSVILIGVKELVFLFLEGLYFSNHIFFKTLRILGVIAVVLIIIRVIRVVLRL